MFVLIIFLLTETDLNFPPNILLSKVHRNSVRWRPVYYSAPRGLFLSVSLSLPLTFSLFRSLDEGRCILRHLPLAILFLSDSKVPVLSLSRKRTHTSSLLLLVSSVTRLGDLLDFGPVFKAFGNNQFPQISHIFRQFL